MATGTPTEPTATEPAVKPYRLTVKQFVAMIDACVFADGDRVELLGGLLVERMTTNDPHDYAVGKLGDLTRPMLPAGWFVREEKSLRFGRFWRPQPDFTIVRGRRQDYRTRTPQPADLALLVEVADSSYAKDRGPKWRGYAAARVAPYWIAHFAKRQLEVYGEPAGRGKSARYDSCRIYGEDAEVPVVIDGREVGRIAVRDLLP